MKHEELKTAVSKLALCIALGFSFPAFAQTANVPLKPSADNEIFFNNFENVFDASGNFKELSAPLAVGDHLVGIINIQNIDADGITLFFSSGTEQLTGFFAQKVAAIVYPDTLLGLNDPSKPPHIVFEPPTVTQFCKGSDCIQSPLTGNEVMRLYHDTGATTFKSSGPTMASDVATAIDGTLWLSLTNVATGGDAGYFYSHVDGFALSENQEDRAYAALNAVVNNTGFQFNLINDVNEIEAGDSPPGTPLLFNDIVMTSELERNPNLPPTGTSPWEIRSNDPATIRPFELVGGACRFTGGGVDTLAVELGTTFIKTQVWNGTFEQGSYKFTARKNVKGNALSTFENRYTFGGQAGANTGAQPQPKGEWTHHQMSGPAGDFVFHVGTASAPAGTEIDVIRCSDPGFCSQARPAPTKQLDFDGIGTFRTIGKGKTSTPVWRDENGNIVTANATSEGNGNTTFDGTFHWVEVNIDDLGEPGNENSGQNLDPAANPAACPPNGFGEKSDDLARLANCDCPDFYRITIYDGVNAADVVFNPDGTIDPSSLNKTKVIYQVKGYINGGNLQIHPPTGFDLNN